MKMNELFEAAAAVIGKKAEENPGKGIKKNGTKITYEQLSKELKSVASWCYKGEIEVEKIVRCKNCKNYKLYRNKHNIKDKGCMRCSLDKGLKPAEHYCSYGENKED